MKYKNNSYLAREAHARDCAMWLAAHVGWVFESRPELLPPALSDYLCELSARLILIPWAGGPLAGLEAAAREIYCTTLVLEPGATNTGTATVYFTVVRCSGGKVQRHTALRLWADIEGSLFLVPDPDGDAPNGDCFAIRPCGIEPAEVPWTNPFEQGFGLGHADTLMLAAKKRWWR